MIRSMSVQLDFSFCLPFTNFEMVTVSPTKVLLEILEKLPTGSDTLPLNKQERRLEDAVNGKCSFLAAFT